MVYTQNWNSEFINNTNFIPKKSFNLCLEIGCFEGLTTNYIVENLLSDNGNLICVDPLSDVYLNDKLSEFDKTNNETIYKYFNNQYERFLENTNNISSRIQLIRKISQEAYPELLKKFSKQIDFIYIDGDHRADAVYLDAVNCYELCKKNGYILFDDYSWGQDSYKDQATCFGIDRFLKEYESKITIKIKNYQLMIEKRD